MNRLHLICTALLGVLESAALAKTVHYGGTIPTVKIPFGEETLLRFEVPVKTISNAAQFIIKPTTEEAADYSLLTIEPREPSGRSDVTFILSDGTTARVRFKVSLLRGQNQDSLVELRPVDTAFSPSETNRFDTDNSIANDDVEKDGGLDLMTAMIIGSEKKGYEVKSVETDVETGFLGLKAKVIKIYDGDTLRGFVFTLQNAVSKTRYRVDVRKLRFGSPNQALFAHIDREILSPGKGKNSIAQLYLVAKKDLDNQDIILPVRPMSTSNAGEKQGG